MWLSRCETFVMAIVDSSQTVRSLNYCQIERDLHRVRTMFTMIHLCSGIFAWCLLLYRFHREHFEYYLWCWWKHRSEHPIYREISTPFASSSRVRRHMQSRAHLHFPNMFCDWFMGGGFEIAFISLLVVNSPATLCLLFKWFNFHWNQ